MSSGAITRSLAAWARLRIRRKAQHAAAEVARTARDERQTHPRRELELSGRMNHCMALVAERHAGLVGAARSQRASMMRLGCRRSTTRTPAVRLGEGAAVERLPLAATATLQLHALVRGNASNGSLAHRAAQKGSEGGDVFLEGVAVGTHTVRPRLEAVQADLDRVRIVRMMREGVEACYRFHAGGGVSSARAFAAALRPTGA
jgi:hypothetical protein